MLAGLTAWLFEQRLRELKAWDRPAWTLNPIARSALSISGRASLATGLLLLGLASPLVASVAAGILLAGWGWTRWVRTDRYTLAWIQRGLSELRRTHPESEESELLNLLLTTRHPEWGPELTAQIQNDHPTVAELARILNRMEQS